ncbi:MAG: hypothetical protein IT372_06810 [Polyangiaceae bacterium]|nr:hypothetical protein [Polyangiaceae bacterium]
MGPYRSALEEATRSGAALNERAAIAGELGLCELRMGSHRDAAEHLRMSVADLAALPPWKRAKLTDAYARAAKEVARVTIAVRPSDAEVLIDDRPIGSGKPTYVVFLEPGEHTARARLSRHSDAVLRLTALQGESQGFSLEFPEVKEPAVAPPAPAPPAAPAAPAAPIAPVAPVAPPVQDETAITLRRFGYATAGAAALIGLGLTISAAVVDGKLADHADGVIGQGGVSTCGGGRSSTDCEALRKMGSTRDALSGSGIISLIAAGVIGGVTFSSHWWAPSERAPGPIQVVPTLEATQAGVTLVKVW